VPEERLGRGAVPPLSLGHNALLTAHRQGMKNWGLVRYGKARELRRRMRRAFRRARRRRVNRPVRCPAATCRNSSSGARSCSSPKVMIVAQPTWGVDVGASAVLRQALLDLSRTGVAILVVSEELEELFEIATASPSSHKAACRRRAREANSMRKGRPADGRTVRPRRP
jgi:general nucleoside transport system ATP-binding protein